VLAYIVLLPSCFLVLASSRMASFLSVVCGSSAIRALWATFFLNSLFTSAQVVGTIISHSVALGGDTGTMVVDSATYLINIIAEMLRLRGKNSARACACVDALAAGISVIALAAVSAMTVNESVGRLVLIASNASAAEQPEDINAQVMFAFTAGNLVIDIGMLGSILLRNRGGWLGLLRCIVCLHSPKRTAVVSIAVDDASLLAVGGRSEGRDAAQGPSASASTASKKGSEINVFSALTHVLADTMRTVTEMTCSLIIWADRRVNGDVADAISALVVSTIIMLIACYVAYETVVLVRTEVLHTHKGPDDSGEQQGSVQPLPA